MPKPTGAGFIVQRREKEESLFDIWGGSTIDIEYDPLIYGVHQVEGIDYETLSLFTSATDKALNSRSFVGESENVIKEFLSDLAYFGLLISLLC